MKKFGMLMFIIILMLTTFYSLSETSLSNTTLFTSTDRMEAYPRRIVILNDIIYAYLSDAKVYAWDGEDSALELYCQLPPIPHATTKNYDELDKIAKDQWEQMVSVIASGDNALWGFNVYNGKIGRIDANGIKWSEVSLNLEYLWPDESRWPLRIVYSFVEENNLYTYVAYDDNALPFNNYTLLEFSLLNGSCREIDIRNAQAVCYYQSGELLLLHNTEDNCWQISIVSLATGTINNSSFPPIIYEKIEPIGGMAYDAKTNRLLFTTNGQVFAKGKDERYISYASVPVTSEVIDSNAFILADGRYALFANSLFVRTVDKGFDANSKLHLQGVIDPRIYADFMQDNPDVVVSFSQGMSSPDDIAQAMITGNDSADVYAVFANNTFRAVVKKGYAAPLTDSSILTEDIKKMYPNIQSVITDASGTPVAYPYYIILTNWQLNDFLWAKVFGEVPPPKTYEEFFDAMLLWESSYAERYPEIGFSGDFDHVFWIKTLINAFAQQYGHANQELSFKSLRLQIALEKLELVCQERKTNGRSVRILEDEQSAPKADIFITMGGHNVLQDPNALRPLESYEQNDVIVVEGIYQEMPSLVFIEGEEPFVPGSMIVWFVNPFSPRKDLAIRYLEYAAKRENNILTFYATHPEAVDPVENSGYQQRLRELQEQVEVLEKALESTVGAERSNMENSLKQAQTKLSNISSERWMISANAIRIHQALAPSIHFFENNPYTLPENSRMLSQLDNYFERYANGSITLDTFLDAIDGTMRLMYLESR